MIKWEDIVKDKLEGYESALPAGSLAEFHVLRVTAQSASAGKRYPLLWVLAAGVVAGIGALLFLSRPTVPDDAIQIIKPPAAPVATATDSIEVSEPVQTTSLFAQATSPKSIKHPTLDIQEFVDNEIDEPEIVLPADGNTDDNHAVSSESLVVEDNTQQVIDTLDSPASFSFVPDTPYVKPVGTKVGPAAVVVGGSGLLIGLSPVISSLLVTNDYGYDDIIKDHDVCIKSKHSIPIKTGISARFPITDRINITTGLEYSLYSSRLVYSLSGEKNQLAHYLSVPIRLDWTVASNNWLDVYVGAGAEGSYCLGATQNGISIPKDGFGITILGVASLQWNVTKNLGLYFEPEMSWTNPSATNPLRTYRTEHSVIFSLSSGLRFTFAK